MLKTGRMQTGVKTLMCLCFLWVVKELVMVVGGAVGQAFAFMKTRVRSRPDITQQPSAASSHLSAPISAASVLLSGLRKQDGTEWRHDGEKKKEVGREREWKQQDRDRILKEDEGEEGKSRNILHLLSSLWLWMRVNVRWQGRTSPPSAWDNCPLTSFTATMWLVSHSTVS